MKKMIVKGQREVVIDFMKFNIEFGNPDFPKRKCRKYVCIYLKLCNEIFYVRPLNGKGYFKNLKVCNKALSKGEYTISK